MNTEIDSLPKEEECHSWTWIGPYHGHEEIIIKTNDIQEFMKMRCLTPEDIQQLIADKLIWRYYGTEESARQLLKLKPLPYPIPDELSIS